MSEPALTCEVLVLGGGPAGFTAALYAARAGLKTVLISPTELSGMMAAAPRVENFPAQPPQTGQEILARIREQALAAGVEQVLDSVAGVNFRDPRALQVFAGGGDHVAGAVIVATGAMARAQKSPGEEQFLGRGVALCVACDGPLFRGLDVLVVGQDEEAVREALALAGLAQSVTMIAPAAQLKVGEGLAQALEATGNLTVETGWRLEEIVGDDSGVTGARFHDAGGEQRLFPAQGVFLYLRGAAPATEFLYGALATDEKGFLLVDELRRTSVEGVFGAGDVCKKEVRQMVVAAAEGCIAALSAERHLRGRATIRLDRGEAKG